MDDLLIELLTETNEHLETIDVEMVRFERGPNNQAFLSNIFRLVHTIKGTCGFLGLPRLEALAHAAETLMGKFRDGMPVTTPAVSLILMTLDQIKVILGELERHGLEPEGSDESLIKALDAMSAADSSATTLVPEAVPVEEQTVGTLACQVIERPLKPDEISLEELERAFQAAPGPDTKAASNAAAPAVFQQPAAPSAPRPQDRAAAPLPSSSEVAEAGDFGENSSSKAQTIRVNADTLEHLMTMVSELVLTHNQLLEISRRIEDQRFKVPLQRLSQVTA